MKAGDKVYCIKSYYDGQYVFIKNKFYIVEDIDDILPDAQRIWIYSETNTTPHGYLGFITHGKLYSNYQYFNEYFATLKELRQLKLQKLNEKIFS